MVTGRPTKYTEKLIDEICAQLSEGISLRTICLADDMPTGRTVWRWLRKHADFCQQYAKAKEESADALVEEMLDIADDGSNDWMARNEPDNEGYAYNSEHVQRSRLRVDTRKWAASKLKAKKYGDKITNEHTGKDGGPIETTATINFIPVSKK